MHSTGVQPGFACHHTCAPVLVREGGGAHVGNSVIVHSLFSCSAMSDLSRDCCLLPEMLKRHPFNGHFSSSKSSKNVKNEPRVRKIVVALHFSTSIVVKASHIASPPWGRRRRRAAVRPPTRRSGRSGRRSSPRSRRYTRMTSLSMKGNTGSTASEFPVMGRPTVLKDVSRCSWLGTCLVTLKNHQG